MISPRFSLKRLVSFVLVSTLASAGVTALESLQSQEPVYAADGAKFRPGLIISDAVFYDHAAMSVEEIQAFLESKLPSCDDDDGGPKCIKDFVIDTPAEAGEDGRCKAVPAKKQQTAAQIIAMAAEACGINPRVLLVKLQKEQGLITLDDPWWDKYNKATGYLCPDTAPCDPKAANFFSQIYGGAGQLQWYGDPRGSFTYFRVGSKITIRYQDPNVERRYGIDCKSSTFVLESQATAALYYYTPYTPNKAALTDLYGTGDTCSAYGNRNFWRMFTDWFGDPIAGSFMVTADGEPTYMIINGQKILVQDALTKAAYKPLGPVGKVSKEYLDSFPTAGGSVPRVVKTNATIPNYFVVDHGKRIDFSCTQIAAIGLNCDSAIVLDANQLSLLPVAQPDIVQDYKGNQFAILGNSKYTITDSVTKAAFASMFVEGTGSDKRIVPPPIISGAYLAKFTNAGEYRPIIKSPSAPCYFVHAGKRFSFTNDAQMAEFGVDCSKAVVVSTAVAQNLPIAGVLSEYMTAPTGEKYLIQDGTKRQIFDAASSQTIGLPALSPVNATAFAWMPIGKPVIRDKILFASETAGEKILHVDGVAYSVANTTASELSLGNVFEASSLKLPAKALEPIMSDAPLKPIVVDPSGQQYILTSAGARKIEPGKKLIENATPVSANFIAAFAQSTASALPATVFVKAAGTTAIYLVESGGKRQLLTTADRAKFAPLMTKTSVESLSASALAQIPTTTPVITPGTFVKDSSTGKTYLVDTLSRAVLVPNTNQAALLGLDSPKVFNASQLAGYTKGAALKNNKLKCGTQTYLTISGALYPVTDAFAVEYPAGALPMSAISCAGFEKSTKAAGVFIKTTDTQKIYYIQDGKKRLISGPNYLAKKQSSPSYVTVGPYFASLIPTGTPVATDEVLALTGASTGNVTEPSAPSPSPSTPAPTPTPTVTPSPSPTASGAFAVGSFVKNASSQKTYWIDVNRRAVLIPNESQAVLLGLPAPTAVSAEQLEGYAFGAVVKSGKIKCGTQVYLTVTGTLYPISLAHAAEYAGGALTVSAEACAGLNKSSTPGGLFIRTADQQIYQVQDGNKKAITGSEYWSLKRSLGSPGFVYVGPYFASLMPTV